MQKGFVSFARAQMVGITSTLLAAHVRPCIVVRILDRATHEAQQAHMAGVSGRSSTARTSRSRQVAHMRPDNSIHEANISSERFLGDGR